MKRAALCLLLIACLLLSGCGWMDGRYISVSPHREHGTADNSDTVSASGYSQLRMALENMIRNGTESTVIYVPEYNPARIGQDISDAVRYARYNYPLGAYAVEEIRYELGDAAGKPAIAVEITYQRTRIEIQKVRRVAGMNQAGAAITTALDTCEPSIVLLVEQYVPTDLIQLVADHAAANPQTVMELPQVTAAVYPESGYSRVVELTFSYENSRESLRLMQKQVSPVFTSAALYISGKGSDAQKYSQLYAFLMERFDYEIATSITPAYSLLRHGVGDPRAFATVYAALCRQSGLDCLVVTGTRDGEPWTWNIICDQGSHLHVDLLRCSQLGDFRMCSDAEMAGYVWDYSAYPACQHPAIPPEIENSEEK